MKLRTALELGRVSNLPTVWTNVLVGAVTTGASLARGGLVFAGCVLSVFYVAGMVLNDAFDRDFDRLKQPQRPIPAGRATAREVFALGFSLLALAMVGSVVLGRAHGHPLEAGLAASTLAALIVAYDMHHKDNPLSPLLMGACRVLTYVTAGVALGGTLTRALAAAGIALLAYLMTLTQVAKRGAGPLVVGRMLAAICLLDAAILFACGQPVLAGFAVLGAPLTLRMQRWVAGT